MTVKWSQTILPVKYDGSISHESIPIIYTGTLAVCDVFSSNSQYTTLLNSEFRRTLNSSNDLTGYSQNGAF